MEVLIYTMMMNENISIIMPSYNNTQSEIEESIVNINKYFRERKIKIEIIVSQNGSKHPLIIKNANVKVIFTKSKGLGIAIKNAFNEIKFKYFYFLPPDIPYNYTDINKMLPLRDNYDLLVGSKLHKDSIYQAPILRRFLTFFQNFTIKILLGRYPIKDPNGTLFGKTKAISSIVHSVRSNDFFFSTELIYLCSKKEILMREIPITYIKKGNSTSVNFLTDTITYFIQLLKLKYI